jgi:hypothetical protein
MTTSGLSLLLILVVVASITIQVEAVFPSTYGGCPSLSKYPPGGIAFLSPQLKARLNAAFTQVLILLIID